jgi:molybdopterin molybdotransferase
MVQPRVAISIGEAIKKVMMDNKSQAVETVALMDSVNRFLAEDLIATENVPSFDRALYDGYAIRAEDTIGATLDNPVMFEVIATIGAGFTYHSPIKDFQAVRIMTGAEMPASCNAIVMLEEVQQIAQTSSKIAITQAIASGDRVFRRGSELTKGTCIAAKGTQITAGVIGLLATFGFHQVKVKKKPIVGVLATGSELLNVDEPLVPGKIRNSNSYMLLTQIEQVGAEGVNLGKLEDDLEKSVEVIKKALQQVDMLITTGGVSVGDYDYLPSIYARIGANVLFNKIAMRPGSVTTVAKLGEQFLFGLSGNPSASFIGFELFVRPVIRKRLGNTTPHLVAVQATLAEDFPIANNYTQLIRGRFLIEDGQAIVVSNGLNMSNSITSIAGADTVAILPPTTNGYKKGDSVYVLLLSVHKGQQKSVFGGAEDAQ